MSRVITFSRTFPAYHPRKGEATHFVEQIWNGLNNLGLPVPKNKELPHEFMWSILPLSNYGYKYHTIRAWHRWKAGDKFSPRVWSGKPYNSKQIIIAPDITVVKTWNFDIEPLAGDYLLNGFPIPIEKLRTIAMNDGFTDLDDFECWFKLKRGEGFIGQIICFNSQIEY